MSINNKTEGQYHELFEEINNEALCIHMAIFENDESENDSSYFIKSGSFAAGYLLSKLGNNWEAIAFAKIWINGGRK
jgi:hypothetical protein